MKKTILILLLSTIAITNCVGDTPPWLNRELTTYMYCPSQKSQLLEELSSHLQQYRTMRENDDIRPMTLRKDGFSIPKDDTDSQETFFSTTISYNPTTWTDPAPKKEKHLQRLQEKKDREILLSHLSGLLPADLPTLYLLNEIKDDGLTSSTLSDSGHTLLKHLRSLPASELKNWKLTSRSIHSPESAYFELTSNNNDSAEYGLAYTYSGQHPEPDTSTNNPYTNMVRVQEIVMAYYKKSVLLTNIWHDLIKAGPSQFETFCAEIKRIEKEIAEKPE